MVVEIHQTLVSEVDPVCDPMVCGLGFHQIVVSEVNRLFLVDIVWDQSEFCF